VSATHCIVSGTTAAGGATTNGATSSTGGSVSATCPLTSLEAGDSNQSVNVGTLVNGFIETRDSGFRKRGILVDEFGEANV
jgi:hypothetical protein